MLSSQKEGTPISLNILENNETIQSRPRVLIIVLGRGVGIHDRDMSNRWAAGNEEERDQILNELVLKNGAQIQPTRLVEKAVIKDSSKGKFGPEEHPMFDNPAKPNDSDSRYAGANANVRATADIVEEILDQNKKDIIGILWAAGRTPDMKLYAPAGLTQGEILARKFIRIMGEQVNGMKMGFEPENVNTWDDLICSMKWAEAQSADEVIVVTVEPHIKRSQDMLDELLRQMQSEGMKIPTVSWVASEDRLIERNSHFKPIIDRARMSRAYDATDDREKRGMESRRSGKYESQWKDGGNKINDYKKPVIEMTPEEIKSRMME